MSPNDRMSGWSCKEDEDDRTYSRSLLNESIMTGMKWVCIGKMQQDWLVQKT